MNIHNSVTDIHNKHIYPKLSRIMDSHFEISVTTFQLWTYIYDQIMDTIIK